MTKHRDSRDDQNVDTDPSAPQPGDEGTPPHPSPAEGGETEPAERPPRPSQAEGERNPG